MYNVMLDLETLGRTYGSVIRSVGAVVFDPYSDRMGEKFYRNVDRKSCEDVGLKVDPDTEAWWKQQSQKAQDALVRDVVHVKQAAEEFCVFFKKNQGMFVWSQGSNFDEPIMCGVFDALGMKPPWKFYDTRDTRTAYGLASFDTRKIRRAGTHHDALSDSEHQARCVQASLKKLGLHDNGKGLL